VLSVRRAVFRVRRVAWRVRGMVDGWIGVEEWIGVEPEVGERPLRTRRRRVRTEVAAVLAEGVRPVSRGRRRISVLRVLERGRL